MPLVHLFARVTMTKAIPLPALQKSLCAIWGTTPQTTKLMLTRVDDWTHDSFNEDIYVSIRAMGKSDRTRDTVLEGMNRVQEEFLTVADLVANVRLETYQKEHYFHLPPKPTSASK